MDTAARTTLLLLSLALASCASAPPTEYYAQASGNISFYQADTICRGREATMVGTPLWAAHQVYVGCMAEFGWRRA
jgi:hypothetical protein